MAKKGMTDASVPLPHSEELPLLHGKEISSSHDEKRSHGDYKSYVLADDIDKIEKGNECPTGAGRNTLTAIPLAVLVFYNVSGGPFGMEQSIRSGGNFFAILAYIIAPFIWSVPEAMVTAELGSAFPEASGAVAWVETAFGKEMGLLSGYLNWISGATDNAIYPALFLEYVTSIMGHLTAYEKEELTTGFGRFFIVIGISALLAGINYRGLEIVGKSSIIICVLSMSPFIIMSILGISKIDPQRWFQRPSTSESIYDVPTDDLSLIPGPLPVIYMAGIFWRPFLNNVFWNLNSFDAAACFSAEMRDVKKDYAKGVFIGLILVVSLYLVPLVVITGATDSTQHEWVNGHFAKVAIEIGGPWLGAWTVFAAGISNLALFEAEMSADALQLMGMAERGYLPKILATRSKKFGTPVYGILIGLVVITLMSVADFSQLVEMLNLNYALAIMIEYSAFVKLRFSHGNLERPYRIPVSKWGSIFFVVPPVAGTFLLFVCSSWTTFIYAICVQLVGVILYKLHHIALANNWCEFAESKIDAKTSFVNLDKE